MTKAFSPWREYAPVPFRGEGLHAALARREHDTSPSLAHALPSLYFGLVECQLFPFEPKDMANATGLDAVFAEVETGKRNISIENIDRIAKGRGFLSGALRLRAVVRSSCLRRGRTVRL